MKLAVIGAGVAGRLLAWRLAKSGYTVELFEKQQKGEQNACSFAAAGILSPLAELEMAELDIFTLGNRSMQLYPQWLKQLSTPVFYRQIGSLVTAHGTDKVELDHFYRVVQRKLSADESSQPLVEKINVGDKEVDLSHLGDGLFIPSEGQVDPVGLMKSVIHDLELADNVTVHYGQNIAAVTQNQIEIAGEKKDFDWVFDCRGLGAKNDLPLRAVRGELLWLKAPDVEIKHLNRLIHPRYRIYVVPRPDNVYLIGATEIESEDYSPVSVRSSLELLSAAYSVHRGFGEARIIHNVVNCRPALPNNLPLVQTDNGLTIINGLYRHGILLAPAVVEQAINTFEQAADKEIGNVQYAN